MQDANTWLKKGGFKIGFLNACSLLNKMSDVPRILSNSNNLFHVFGFSETRFTDDNVSDKVIAVPGYTPLNRPAKNKLETGIIAHVHQSVSHKRLDNFDRFDIECIWIEIRLKGTKPILVGYVYRNPAERTEWIDRFDMMLEDISNQYTDIIIMGDFNINLLTPHEKWKRTYQAHSLSQLVNTPTRITSDSQTLIDHIYATNTSNIIELSVPAYGLSDHFPLCLTWSKKGIKVPRCTHKEIYFRSYKTFKPDTFLHDLYSTDFSPVYQYTDPDMALTVWYEIFKNIFDKHVPYKVRRVKQNAKPAWLNDEIESAIKHRDKLLATTGKDENFRKQRNKITSLKRTAKKKFFGELIASRKDSKSIWKAINMLSGKSSIATTHSTQLSVDCLNTHFSNIANKTVLNDRSKENDLSLLSDYCHSKSIKSKLNFEFLSVHEVYKELCSLKQSNTRGIDTLDGKILKIAAPIISEHLTYIYNLCIEKRHYPQAFKDAKVIPVFKSGDPNDPTNYRPISILSTLSKPLEKHLKTKLHSHFNKYNLFHPNQSGFREKHSCHTALTNLVEKWHENINNDQLTGVIFLDFQKAFDVIDHTLLSRKLNLYGLASNAVELLFSFLSNRRQAVFKNSEMSQFMPVSYGVPQGSILGPIIFSIYINDLPLHISSECELFADDTTVHNTNKNADLLFSHLQEDIEKLQAWTDLNHMALHPQKSKFMLVTTRQKRQNMKHKLIKLRLNGKQLENVESHKLLGITLDYNLSWSNHILNLTKKLSRKIFQFNRIKHFLDQHTRKLFFHAFIQTDIDYASTCWDSCSKHCLKPLTSLYKRSIKIILLKTNSPVASDYKELNILPFDLRCRFNKGILMYKTMKNLTPRYLRDKFILNKSRYKTKILIPRPRTDLFMSSFTYSGAKLWNELGDHLKNISSLSYFKKAFSKHLFDSYI